MTTPQDREPVPPRWDDPPQPPAWDRPVGAQQGWGPPPAYAPQPGYGSYGPPAQTDGKAVAGLVLAIGSWLVLPFLAAIVALVLAGSSSREIAASGGRLGGQGINTATRWVAWLNILFCVLAVAVAVAALVLFASAGSA